jgi:hypothetical protein
LLVDQRANQPPKTVKAQKRGTFKTSKVVVDRRILQDDVLSKLVRDKRGRPPKNSDGKLKSFKLKDRVDKNSSKFIRGIGRKFKRYILKNKERLMALYKPASRQYALIVEAIELAKSATPIYCKIDENELMEQN